MFNTLMAALEGRAVYINGVGVIGLVIIFTIVTVVFGLWLLHTENRRRV